MVRAEADAGTFARTNARLAEAFGRSGRGTAVPPALPSYPAPAGRAGESGRTASAPARFQFSLRSLLLAVFFLAPLLGLFVVLGTTSGAARLPRGEWVEHPYFTIEIGTLNAETFSDDVTCAHWKIAPKPEFGRCAGSYRLLCEREILPETFIGPVEVLCRKRRIVESCSTCHWELELDVWGWNPNQPGRSFSHLLYWKTTLPMGQWGRPRLEDATAWNAPPAESLAADENGVRLTLATHEQARYLAANLHLSEAGHYPKAEPRYESPGTALAARLVGLPDGPETAVRWMSLLWCLSLLPAVPAVVWCYRNAA